MLSQNTANKTEMKKEIKKILITGNYQHPIALLSDNSMSTLKGDDLTDVYRLLIHNILHTVGVETNSRAIKRPPCPITGIDKFNQARFEYKSTMIQYIKQFGIHLRKNAPCNYPPAILEALANYCEKNMRGTMKVEQVSQIQETRLDRQTEQLGKVRGILMKI